LYIKPDDALQKEDFVQLAQMVDPYIQQHGSLAGLIVDAAEFPGWDDFAALASHLRFVKDHHKLIKKIALVTNSKMGSVAEHLGAHFVAAKVRHFPAHELAAAAMWITSGT
jgi:hypothetical protein